MSTKSNKKKASKKKSAASRSSKSSAKRRSASRKKAEPAPLIYSRKHYLLMAAGFGIMIVGMLLMTGGGPENYNDWNPDRIYSFRRTVLAPIVIIGGLIFEIYVIFKK